nr:hypothetical protein CFP56_70074 [Quercus suber]
MYIWYALGFDRWFSPTPLNIPVTIFFLGGMEEVTTNKASNCPELKNQYCDQVWTTISFAREIEDFDDLVDPRHLFDCCLGPEPTNYLSSEEKVVVANSKVDSIEAESSMLRKDLIEAMDLVTKAKEKVKDLKDALKVEKKLVIQKDEEVQAALLKIDEEREKYFKGFELLCRWMMKYYSQVEDFANLDFKAINTEILADETKEKEGETVADVAARDGTITGGVVDKAHMDNDHVEEVVTTP